MDLQGKTILITGAARGLGQKMAEVIANQGANLALADVDHEALKETVRLCSKDDNKVKDYAADVTQEVSVDELFRSIRRDFGGLDGCINNAGVTSDGLLVKITDGKVQSKMSVAQFNKVIAVDLMGVFLCGRKRRRSWPRVGTAVSSSTYQAFRAPVMWGKPITPRRRLAWRP